MIPPEPANDLFGPPREHAPLRPSRVEPASEERSEDDGMPEHARTAVDSAACAAPRPALGAVA